MHEKLLKYIATYSTSAIPVPRPRNWGKREQAPTLMSTALMYIHLSVLLRSPDCAYVKVTRIHWAGTHTLIITSVSC